MSALVKLSSKLPGDPEINGLDHIARELEDPDRTIVALVWLQPVKVMEDLATGDRVPTVQVGRIEPIGTPMQAPQEVQTLAANLYEKRTGRNPLPFEELVAPAGELDVVDDESDELL